MKKWLIGLALGLAALRFWRRGQRQETGGLLAALGDRNYWEGQPPSRRHLAATLYPYTESEEQT